MISVKKNGEGKYKASFDLSNFITVISIVAAILIFYFTQLSDIKDDIASNKNCISKIEVKVCTNEKGIENLKSDVNEDISEVKGVLTEIRSDIKELIKQRGKP